nr:ATP-binding protein [Methylogaea oryzae]
MIYLTDGVYSSYHSGLNLAIIAVGLLLPTSISEAIIFCVLTVILYSAACLIRDTQEFDPLEFYKHQYFIILTSIIAITSVYFNTRRRFSEFRISYELDGKNKQLSELDRLKSQFFANVSHELRTPLTLILAPTEDLLNKPEQLPSNALPILATIRNNALRLLRLVNDLLDLNRLEEGESNLESRPVDINRLASGLGDSMRHLAESRGLAFRQALAPTPLIVHGDPHALEKIVLNLLGNAVKFTETGGTVQLSTESSGASARIIVRDDGIGIGSGDLPYIFDRFRQADGSSTRRYQGTGLGLALAKELVEKQGGSIRAESRPGAGTTMTVQLPLAATEAVEPDPTPVRDTDLFARFFRSADFYLGPEIEVAAPRHGGRVETEPSPHSARERGAASPAAQSSPDAGAKATLLIVDDEPDMRGYLRDVLTDEFTVWQADDGAAGLALIKARRPDLVLLDLMMPKMDGLAVCRAIRGDAALADIKVILLTARVDEQAKLAALDCGADDFLTKPFSRVEVCTRLRNLARSAALQRDVRQRNRELEAAMADLRRAHDQLIQSEKLNAIGMLTAGLLHEVNNPLNYAHTTLQILQEDPSIQGDERLARALERIRHGMNRIRDIVANLRTFARPSPADKATRFSLAAALDTALTLTAHEMKGIECRTDIPADCHALGAHDQIEQILINLLSNAAKAVAQREAGVIRVTAERDGGRIVIRVRDNGKGIAPDALAKVFDPFYTTADVGHGMGLGLSICHTIAANHGGNLRVASEEGEWTEFAFDLAAA